MYFGESYHQQYLAKPGARPYCSAKPQGVSVPSYEEWTPFGDDAELNDYHRPKLPETFWSKHAPQKGCSVVNAPNGVILAGEY